MIKAIIFDVDGVLIDSFESNLKFLQNLMSHFGYPLPTRDHYHDLHHRTLKDNIKILTQLTDEDEIAKIIKIAHDNTIINDATELVVTPPNLIQALKLLSKKYQLAIVTQSSRFKQRAKSIPHLSEFIHLFEVVVDYHLPVVWFIDPK